MAETIGPLRDLGPCEVIFDGSSLGETFGGVTFRHSQETVPVRTDRGGTTDRDNIFVGETCEVEASMSRNALAELSAVMPGATGSGTSGDQMVVRSVVGRSSFENAAILILKPIVEGVTSVDTANWLTVFIASPRVDLELQYDNENQRTYKLMFKGYPVQTAGSPAATLVGWLYKIGA